MTLSTITVLGATGPTGSQLVSQCLSKGYRVVAFGRSPEKLQIQHDNLKVVKGDIFSTEELSAVFKNCAAVMSCLGYNGFSKNTFYEGSMKHIVEAMRRAGVKRLLALTSWYVEPLPDDPFFIRWFVRPLVLSEVLASMRRMEHLLAERCSDIEYTIVRPPHLANGPSTDTPIVTEVDKFSVKSTASYSLMNRSDVARFLLNCFTNESHIRQFVAVKT